ncbi:O-antigen ligase family protein [Robiginitalea sp. IMCC43444]|uniref:O-antigen ligase family protein n=1 Tax=Robiginitalea sp. IMCC43444 TaxID=3459121 RepID=UPI00404144D1
MILYCGIILSLESRLFLMAFPILLLFFTLLYFRKVKIAILSALLAILAGTVFFVQHPARFHNIRLLRLDEAGSVRMSIYGNTWEVIEDNWAFGTGTGDFHQELYAKYDENEFQYGKELGYNAHNQFLEEWARSGIPGLLALVAILWVGLSNSFTRKPIFFVFLGSAVLFFLVESALNRQQGISFFVLFYCLFIIGASRIKPETTAKNLNSI